MAMTTYVQMVSDDEIAKLKKTPASINKLDKPDAETFRTHYFCSLNYFLTGDAYGGDHVLGPALSGADTVDTATLENGSFGTCTSAEVAKLAKELVKVDQKKFVAKVKKADWDELRDEEVEDGDFLEAADAPKELGDALTQLVTFYTEAAKKKLGVAMYTT